MRHVSMVPFYKINDNESQTLVKERHFTTRFKTTTLNNLTLNKNISHAFTFYFFK